MLRSRVAVVAASAVALLLGSIFVLPVALSAFGPRLVLRPRSLTPAEANPARWGLAHAGEVRFPASDGVQLHGWWAPAEQAPACGTVILFHGRSANIATRASVASWLVALGYNAFLFDYRGYGASDRARPGEAELYRDGIAAYRYATAVKGAVPERLVLLGQSMGTAVAADVAARNHAAGLVLISPYTSGPGLVRQHLPRWFPAGWPDWQRNRFDVQARVVSSGEPLVVAASHADRQVPYAESRTLFDAAREPKHWVEVDSVPHNGLLQSVALQRQLTLALQRLLPCPRFGAAQQSLAGDEGRHIPSE